MNFSLHKNFSELDPSAWNDLLSASITDVPFLRFEYLSAWWKTRGGGEWPHAELALVSASEDGRLLGIAPLFKTEHEGEEKLLLLGSIEISDYLDLIVRAGDLPRFISGLLEFCAVEPAIACSRFDWYNLPDDSPTVSTLESESTKRGWGYTKEPFRPSLSVPLPADFESYLAGISKKQRHEIRRKMRRAENDERDVRWYILADESRLDAEIEEFLSLMANDHHKEEFLTEVMRTQMRASMHAAFKAGWLQLAFMEVDGTKAAGYLNFDHGDRIYVYNSGIDFNYGDLSPGWVLLGYLFQWAIAHGRREFDFMRGDEDYKYKFGGLRRDVMRVRFEIAQNSGI